MGGAVVRTPGRWRRPVGHARSRPRRSGGAGIADGFPPVNQDPPQPVRLPAVKDPTAGVRP
ncbi:hypothetical protein [Azospirillum largimobile]